MHATTRRLLRWITQYQSSLRHAIFFSTLRLSLTDRVDDLQGHHLVGEELQGPGPNLPRPQRWRSIRFRLAIELPVGSSCVSALQGNQLRDQALRRPIVHAQSNASATLSPTIWPIGIHLSRT